MEANTLESHHFYSLTLSSLGLPDFYLSDINSRHFPVPARLIQLPPTGKPELATLDQQVFHFSSHPSACGLVQSPIHPDMELAATLPPIL